MSGKKNDAGKTQWHLLNWDLIEEVAEILSAGAEEYGARNYRDVEGWKDRYFDALQRHIRPWMRGTTLDSKSGKSHLAHAICNLMILHENNETKVKEKISDMDMCVCNHDKMSHKCTITYENGTTEEKYTCCSYVNCICKSYVSWYPHTKE